VEVHNRGFHLQGLGYYQEYVHPTPGMNRVGPQRIVLGNNGQEIYYTPDHYDTFIPINPRRWCMAFEMFKFAEPGTTWCDGDSFIAVVSAGINDAMELLKELYERLNLPGYFGFNWDALSDCLRDFDWIKERNIVLIHEDIPALPVDDLKNYLEVLDVCVRSWKPNENHRLIVVFANAFRHRIEQMGRKT
jgi:hypothetical protein